MGNNFRAGAGHKTALAFDVPQRRAMHQIAKDFGSLLFGVAGWSPNLQRRVAGPAHRIKQHVEIAHVVQVQVGQEEFIENSGGVTQAPQILRRAAAYVEDKTVAVS